LDRHYAEPTERLGSPPSISVDMTRAVRLARKLGVPVDFTSLPAPAVGGYPIPFNLFESVVIDLSHAGVKGQAIVDALNRTVGAARDRVRVEAMHLINPAWWLWSVLVFVLRIPFRLPFLKAHRERAHSDPPCEQPQPSAVA